MNEQRPLIAVVGVCASGKSTLAAGLRAAGWNARQVLQEHSYVPYMWRRITNPDILIYLDCALDTTRLRRKAPDFPDWIYANERHRLRHAREHCDLYIATDDLSPQDILALTLEFVAGWQTASEHSF
jgi:deoxyadenosine/deoxycytidine kinase